MPLKFKNKKDFGLKLRDDNLRAQNTTLARGGSVVVGERWVQFGDLRFDAQQLVSDYMSSASRRIFNFRGDIMYVLVCVDGYGALRVVPSIAMNKKNFGDVKIFPDLSGLLPLMLVKLRHDGSENLSAMLAITPQDIEIYKGHGNFTSRGLRGATGAQGATGWQGITGWSGCEAYGGPTGAIGYTGIAGLWLRGETGVRGIPGESVPAYQSSFSVYIQDVVDPTVETWQDTVDDTEDTVQDIV